jgi:uncharacterized YccA/Bax inhibitor family protein
MSSNKLSKGFSKFTKMSGLMSINGVVNKSLIMLGIIFISSIFTWNQVMLNPMLAYKLILIFSFSGFVLALITIFKVNIAHITAPLYALSKGLFLGAFSSVIEQKYPGIPMQAVLLTFGVFFAMFIMYRYKIIKVTERFQSIMSIALGGIFIAYLMGLVLSFFGITPFFSVSNTSLISIGFSLLVVGIASLSLLLDFDEIEKGIKQGAPKQMEWYASFGLMVTLVWLYIEIISLLLKIKKHGE